MDEKKNPDDPDKIAYELPDEDRPTSVTPTEQALGSEIPGGSSSAAGHDPYAAWRHRNFRLYALGWVCSVVGFQIQGAAVGWEVYERTGKSFWLGVVGGIQALPVILLALPAGQLADLFNRKLIIFCAALLTSLCSFGLAYLSYREGSLPLMYVLLGLGSATLSIGRPARAALITHTVPISKFNNAVTWNSSLQELSVVFGSAIGGFIIHFSIRSAYLIDGVCQIILAILILMISINSTERKREPVTLKSLLAGLRFVRDTRVILAAISLDMFAVLFGGAVYLLPVFAKDVLHVQELRFGFLRAAPACGAFVMAILLAHLPPMRHAGRNLLMAVAGFGLVTIVFGLSKNYWLSLAMLFLTGVFDNVSVVIRHTLVQVLTPDHMRGRVSAVNQVFIGASNELGGFESGMTAGLWGPVNAVVVGGIGTLAVVMGAAWCWPQLLKVRELHKLKSL